MPCPRAWPASSAIVLTFLLAAHADWTPSRRARRLDRDRNQSRRYWFRLDNQGAQTFRMPFEWFAGRIMTGDWRLAPIEYLKTPR